MIPAASRDAVLYAEAEDGELIGYRVTAPRDGDGAEGAPGSPPVLLVHGFASDAATTWERTGWVRALTDAGRTVITLDLRGHGASDKPIAAASYTPEVFGADLLAVLDTAGVDRADAIGYSMGTRILSAAALLAPERLRRVVIGGAGPNELFASWDLDEVRGLLLRGESTGHPLVDQVLKPALSAGGDAEALLGVVEGFAGAPLEFPRGIRSLFVVGEDDPVPAGAGGLAEAWGSELVAIPRRDHVSTLTARAFKDAAIAFLASP
ncbi:pimeloyl-ACP methyl ester carboxylesterase [Agromyces terreus]|uniref:Pimeloyl-ACP methyl ester carboxylesterase n=1 Tax=Agromyces terreus TaxID=424795 RepID=A0A9X2H5L8_9MICO|nr:alpha/beta hydrolase [Agromyces terreus]MCP2371207.1 pimeloyl-ACP methyl ester carboxylesterase [Agromyces terreus]